VAAEDQGRDSASAQIGEIKVVFYSVKSPGLP